MHSAAGRSRSTAIAAPHGQLQGRHVSSSGRGSSARGFAARRQWQQHSAAQLLPPALAASNGSSLAGPAASAAADAKELPLWRYLLQQGFSAGSISRMHRAAPIGRSREGEWCSIVNNTAMTEAKVQRDVAPKVAALRAEGLDTASIGALFEQYPVLLTTKHATFASALAALRQLAARLPDDPRAVQAPPGATQLGVALWIYPSAAALLLTRTNLGSLIERNLRLRQRLGISDAATTKVLFERSSALVSKFERAEAMVAHLQGLQASGALS